MPSKQSAKTKKMISEKRELDSKKTSSKEKRHPQVRINSRSGETTSRFTKSGTPISKTTTKSK